MLHPCKDSLLSGWFVHSKGQAAEIKVTMNDCKLICTLIMLETRVKVSHGALQWFCLDLFWVLGEWQPKTLVQAKIGWTMKKSLSQRPAVGMHQNDGMWIAFFSKWSIHEHPWVPLFCYVTMQEPADAGVGEPVFTGPYSDCRWFD